MMNFEELDEVTRRWMLGEFQNEEKSGNPYRSNNMTHHGIEQLQKIMGNMTPFSK